MSKLIIVAVFLCTLLINKINTLESKILLKTLNNIYTTHSFYIINESSSLLLKKYSTFKYKRSLIKLKENNSKQEIMKYKSYYGDTILIETENYSMQCQNYTKNGLYKSQKELDDYTNHNKFYKPECADYLKPVFDFNSFDLIWANESTGGCEEPIINYRLLKIPSEKKYLFILQVEQIGYCKTLNYINLTLKFKKLEKDYIFQYKCIKSTKS